MEEAAHPVAPGSRMSVVAAPPGPTARRHATLALLLVCVGVVVAHAVIVGLDRPINWDEAIHLSQVNPHRPAVFMEPHRTRGLSLLVAPIAVFDPSMTVLRAYVLVVGAAGLFAAFRVWIHVIGWGAPAAAALFATHWITIFYSVEVLPNYPAALLAVGAAGVVARAVSRTGADAPGPARTVGVQLAVLFAVFALVRPPDAVVVGVALGLVLLAGSGRSALRPLLLSGLGGLAGLLPWLLEGWIRFGLGPLQTVRSAGEYGVRPESIDKLPLYLRYLETQLRCAGSCLDQHAQQGVAWQLPPGGTTAFLVVAALLTLLALVVGGGRERRALAAPLLAGAAVVVFYAWGAGSMNLRYLMPAYALLLLPAAFGGWLVFGPLLGRWPRARADLARLMALGLLLVVSLWQLSLALERFDRPSTRDRAAEVGRVLADVADGDDCAVITTINYPQLQYWSGCQATVASDEPGQLQPPLGALGSYVDANAWAQRGARVFAVADDELPADSPLQEWRVVTPGGEPVRGRHVYEHVDGAPLPPPPCPQDREALRTLAERLSTDC